MKKTTALIALGVATLGIGSGFIFGNSYLASQAMEEKDFKTMAVSLNDENQSISLDVGDIPVKELNEEPEPIEENVENEGKKSSVALASDENLDLPLEGEPGKEDLTEDEAVEIAINELKSKYALSQEALDRFTIIPTFFKNYGSVYTKECWRVELNPTIIEDFPEIGCYMILLDGKTGDIIKTTSAADGIG